MQHHFFVAVPANNSDFNNDQEQSLSQWTPGREVQDVDDGSTEI